MQPSDRTRALVQLQRTVEGALAHQHALACALQAITHITTEYGTVQPLAGAGVRVADDLHTQLEAALRRINALEDAEVHA